MKKNIFTIIVETVILIVVVSLGLSVQYNRPNESKLIMQFGQVVGVKSEEGPFLIVPFFQSVHNIYTGDNMYDLPLSDVITSDKKTMTADAYSVWNVTDPLVFYQSVASQPVAESRLNVAIYNSMKNLISASSQMDVIGGKDGSLGERIRDNIRIGNQYGIDISKVEMKLLDLPDENKSVVYSRMISERKVIEMQFQAEGEKVYNSKKAEIDSKVRQIVSDAEVKAALIEADAEAQYYQILADAYSSSQERKEFYQYLIQLEALKKSLKNGGTIVLDSSSPLYDVINRVSDKGI